MTTHPARYIGLGFLVLIGTAAVPPMLDWWEVANLPPAVLETVEQQFPGGRISEIETSVMGGATVYDIHVRHKWNLGFVCVTPGGRVLYISRNAQGVTYRGSA